MSMTAVKFGMRCWFLALTILRSSAFLGQAAKPPTFTPSGVQGTLAPSGYSAAAAAQDTSQIMRHATNLGQEDDIFPSQTGDAVPGCSLVGQLLSAAQAEPESFNANHALGVFYLYHQDFSRSLPYLRRASSLKPSDLQNLRYLALAYTGDKQYSQAIALLRRAASDHRTDATVARSLAMAFEASGDSRSAVSEYQRAAAVDASEQNQFASGMGLIMMGAADQAATSLGAATAVHPDSARLWMGLGVAQYLQQHKESALRSLIRATDLDPGYLPSYSSLALLYGAVPVSDAEIKRRLGALVVSHPESADAHFDYALALLKERTLGSDAVSAAEIEAQLKLAIDKDPDLADAHLQLGALYADSNDFPEAIREYQKTLQLEPENVRAHYRLALAYRRNKQTALADEELQKFKALDASFPHRGSAMGDDTIELPSMSMPSITRNATCP